MKKYNPNLKRYKDAYGEVWEKINFYEVRRVSDGNIGGWHNGKGLILIEIIGYDYEEQPLSSNITKEE